MKSRTARESAALAARLIAVEGSTWRAAFAEARRLFGEPPQENAVAREIRRWFALFDPQAHEAQLRRKRIAALRVMEALAELDPKLVGVVLGGHAVERSPAEVAVRAESEKEVLFRLFDAGFAPEDFSENYPTALARGPAKVLATFILHVGEETVLLRVLPLSAPLPRASEADEDQHPLEAAGAVGADELRRLLAETRSLDLCRKD